MKLIGTILTGALLACGHTVAVQAAAPAVAAPPAFPGMPPPPPPGKVYPAALPKGKYAALDKLPDWGGAWTLNFGPPPAGVTTVRESAALKGKYLAAFNEYQKQVREHQGLAPKATSNCMPPGMPVMMGMPQYPIEFLITPGRVTMLFEAWAQWRVIFTDGRPHPADWEGGIYGHSTGRWEGDTLMIDTVGIKTITDISMGAGHSDKLHISERIHLAKGKSDVLLAEMTIEDPEALEKPLHQLNVYNRQRDWNLQEFICAENDRNPVSAEGETGFEMSK
jgi:hypothetical protein